MKKVGIIYEWLTTHGKTEGSIERFVIFPFFGMLASKYAPASSQWLINSILAVWLVVMGWKLVTLLRGKEWK
ncbi:MAG: hypothetical protein K6A96_09600 [Prevotella sp.]|nr:hypothetical protein [Prevotella sp.]